MVMSGRTYSLYADRPGWADVRPVAQDDDPRAVIQIAYTERYTDCMDYLRAVMRSGELSARCLELTRDCLEMNAANYSIWHYRRQLLAHQAAQGPGTEAGEGRDLLRAEMDFVGAMIEESPKNYQVWHHRRWLVQELGDPSAELDFTLESFDDDPKNYHAWEHRQWAVRRFALWDGEEATCKRLLGLDRRNNSAWNHLFFVTTRGAGLGAGQGPAIADDATVERLNDYVEATLRADPDNESAWAFLRGLYSGRALHGAARLWALAEELAGRVEAARVVSPHVHAFLVDLLSARLEAGEAGAGEDLQRAAGLLVTLAEELDPVRRRYWNYLRRRLLIRFGRAVPGGEDGGPAPEGLLLDGKSTTSSSSGSEG